MTTAKRKLFHLSKMLTEKMFGVYLEQHPRSKHFYPELLNLRSWSSQNTIFDIGANDGRTAVPLRQLFPSTPIYAFEPVSDTYRQLVQRTKHLDNVHCFQLALGAHQGQKAIHLHEIAALNTFSENLASSIGTEAVQVSTVDQIMVDLEIDFIDFLKIDTEGHELEVLEGAQKALESLRIAIIQVEVGFDQVKAVQVSLEEVKRYLAPKGYFLYGIYNQCHTKVETPPSWSKGETSGYNPRVLVYCDAVFIGACL